VYSLGVKVQTHLGDSGKGPKINQAQNAAGVDEFTLCTQDMYAEIICDECGIHLSPYTIRSYIKAKGVEKIILITDSYPKTGDYKNNEEDGIKFGPDLNYDANGLLAGSHLTLDNACRNVMSYTGYGLCNVIRFASYNPAKLLGIDNLYGSIKEGKIANLILIDGAVRVKKVMLEGEIVIENLIDSVKEGKNIIITNKTNGKAIECECELSERAKKIVLAGGLLSFTKEQM
jgi:N-acetylglucosamine-6-phosphate deacetylase